MASYIGASAEQEDADPILLAFAAEAAKGVLQRRVGHGGDDGVRVRVPVSGDIDGVHEYSLSSGCGASNFWRVDSFIMRLRCRFVNSPQAGKPGAGRAKTASASGGGGGFAPVRDGVYRVSK